MITVYLQGLLLVLIVVHPGVSSIFVRTEKNMGTMHSWAPPERWRPFVKFRGVSDLRLVAIVSYCM
jgi:hypothetical protein